MVRTCRAQALLGLEVVPDGYRVEPATLQEAEAWWSQHRPSIPPLPALDENYGKLDELTTIDLDNPTVSAVRRFGGKAANLAILYRYLSSRHQVPGFAIPSRYYLDFLRDNTIPSLTDPNVDVTYEEYLGELLEDSFRRHISKRNLRQTNRVFNGTECSRLPE